MSSTRLTIFLLRDIASFDDVTSGSKSYIRTPLDPDSGLVGEFLHSSRPATPPKWVWFVNPVLKDPLVNVSSSSASGLLILLVQEHYFAISFGYGRGFLDPAKIERQFGLKVALNRINPTQIRSMDTKTFEDMVVTRNTQTSKSSELPSFGVDVSRDILRAVTGEPADKSFAKRLSGSDALVVSLDLKAADLPAKLAEFLDAYKGDEYKANFEWIDHLAQVTDDALLETLNSALETELKASDTSSTHMAMPESIDWEDVDVFRIGGTRRHEYEDLDLDAYLAELGTETSEITIDRLKSRPVSIKFGRSNDFEARWNIYQCLVSEQRIAGSLYVLIEGRWFSVSESLVDEVDDYVGRIPSTAAALLPLAGTETEPIYNARVAASDPQTFLLLDARIKRPGGAASGIEVCDLLSSNREFIHIKRKSRSSTLSHLFAQGTVSARTFIGDPTFREEIRDLIANEVQEPEKAGWLALIPDGNSNVRRSDYTVSYVVLAESSKKGSDWLPFFSKLNLMQHARQIDNLGLHVTLTRVGT